MDGSNRLVALGFRRRPDGGRVGRAVIAVAKAGLLACGVALLAGFFLFVTTIERTEPTLSRRAQGVVALTGGADRIADALDLLATGQADRLLITGVNQSTTRPEIARLTPRMRPLFSCCIDLGYEALNTVGNAAETQRWVRRHGMHSVIVVTSNYHMPRALVEIGRVLPGVELVPYPVVTDRQKAGAWWVDPGMLRLLAVEYVKYLAAVTRAHLATPPSPDADVALMTARPI